MIKHKCQKCQKEILNKVAPDDNYVEFVQKLNKIKKGNLDFIIRASFFCAMNYIGSVKDADKKPTGKNIYVSVLKAD